MKEVVKFVVFGIEVGRVIFECDGRWLSIKCMASIDLDLVFIGKNCFYGDMIFFAIDDNVCCIFLF